MKPLTKYLKILVNIISVIVLIIFLVYVLPKAIIYFMPFALAILIALIAEPLVRFLEKRLKFARKAGTAVVIIAVIAMIVLVAYLIIAKLVTETSGLLKMLPSIYENISNTMGTVSENVTRYSARMPVQIRDWISKTRESFGDTMSIWITDSGAPIATFAGNFALNLPTAIIYIIMTAIASYLFLADRAYLENLYEKLVPSSVKNRLKIVSSTMKEAVGGYFKAQFKIMAVVYIILLVGFIVLRIEYAMLIALLIAILDFLPFFGTGTVMIPWGIIAFLQDNYKHAIGILIIWAISQLVRQLIQPKFLGDSMGLEPIPTLVLLYLGYKLGGAFGLIIAVPIGMIFINLYKAGVFTNLSYSLQIAGKDLANFRRFTDEELKSEGIVPFENDVFERSDKRPKDNKSTNKNEDKDKENE